MPKYFTPDFTLTLHLMKYDLLIQKHDYYTSLFIDGIITYDIFELIEIEYLKRKELFTINLN